MLSFVFPGKKAINRIKEGTEERADGQTVERGKIDRLPLALASRSSNLYSDSGEYYVSRLSISRLLSLGMEADVTWAQSQARKQRDEFLFLFFRRFLFNGCCILFLICFLPAHSRSFATSGPRLRPVLIRTTADLTRSGTTAFPSGM